ncbi:zinc-finger protein [Malassezia vespertilionis]|uniref:zinc-finger protein n=1 Tax=Malassezia vespertilionis TaxID=2020962 RepID=UPI0024B1DE9E|nr:zinc-finger protein [Malassezia vespertilionis]WFD05432.1 zinc-finger protein [Malassezia vespertilionis]
MALCTSAKCDPWYHPTSFGVPDEQNSLTSSQFNSSSSTPLTSHHSSDTPMYKPPAFRCQWANCCTEVSSLEALTEHVQRAHLSKDAEAPERTTPFTPAWPQALLNANWGMDWASDSANTPLMCSTPTPTEHASSSLAPRWKKEVRPAAAEQKFLANFALPDEKDLLSLEPTCLCAPGEGKKKHPCGWEDCNESFDTHTELTDHLANQHVGCGRKEYECRWVGCKRAAEGRKFHQKQKVLRHIQTHTGDRPYVCPLCQKRFSEMNTLTQHIRIHTKERPYKCDFPGCDKSFSVAGSLTIHKRTHTGYKPFKCPFPDCDKEFSESSNLNKHMRVHRGEKLFGCTTCTKRFARPDQLARHKKVHERQDDTFLVEKSASSNDAYSAPVAT